MRTTIDLRLHDTMDDLSIVCLPVVFTGTITECQEYAASRGYKWRSMPSYLFGGYFAHPDTGSVLYPS